MKKEITLISDRNNIRIDKYLANEIDFSRSFIQKLIGDKLVLVNGKVIEKDSYEIKKNDNIIVRVPELESLDLKPVDLDLEILF